MAKRAEAWEHSHPTHARTQSVSPSSSARGGEPLVHRSAFIRFVMAGRNPAQSLHRQCTDQVMNDIAFRPLVADQPPQQGAPRLPGSLHANATTKDREVAMRFVLACLLAVTGCAGSTQTSALVAQQYPHQLTAAEIRTAIPNSTQYALGAVGPKTYATYYSADGHIHFKAPDGDDHGTFRITDDGLICTKYDQFRSGQETCQTVWLTAPDTLETHLANGQVVKPSARSVGNPEGL